MGFHIVKRDNCPLWKKCCLYLAAVVTRTVLEPRLVGKQLGLDPLATLVALYLGYRFWGIVGLVVTPILASAASSLMDNGQWSDFSGFQCSYQKHCSTINPIFCPHFCKMPLHCRRTDIKDFPYLFISQPC